MSLLFFARYKYKKSIENYIHQHVNICYIKNNIIEILTPNSEKPHLNICPQKRAAKKEIKVVSLPKHMFKYTGDWGLPL